MKNFRQGFFKPKNPHKYIGDLSKIVYRSSWELHAFTFLDNNVNILQWASEPVAIKYISPKDNQIHKYYIDLFVMYKDKNGNTIREMLEIKPSSQTTVSKSKNKKTRLQENLTFEVNKAKWLSAKAWCESRGITFRVITERSLFLQ